MIGRIARQLLGILTLILACFFLAFECSAVFDPDGTRLAGEFLFLKHDLTFTYHALLSVSILGLFGMAVLFLMWRPFR